MKKVNVLVLTLFMCLTTIMTHGQWTYKTINSDFDGAFKKAYTEINNGGYLMMEVGTSSNDDTIQIIVPFFALSGSYFCDDYTNIDFVFIVNGINKKYELTGIKSSDSKLYFFNESIWTNEFIKDFKSASKCSIRVNQDYCEDDYYQFNFSGSTNAYNFIVK
jgi:hypothetical protein